ncbi:olfactory receptor 6Q1-like [Spea bombifrons]|uniref:olfactory receptor 6Q1-like n=1 Tax=Spea bombifrons TaxID=233779 RepID=UPI00234B82B5|nr:olfactory receptor 6Q1-like [Spea bombifrons]
MFMLLQLWDSHDGHIVFSITFTLIYVLTLTGNFMIITICRLERTLGTPMYFFLSHLATLEICYISVIVPKMLYNSMSGDNAISYIACLTQLYFFGSLGSTECFLLAIMAYDRYLAVCKPLHYHAVMTSRLCFCLAACCWTSGFISTLSSILLISTLQFCGPEQIQHFFCDISPLLKLSCTDVQNTETLIFLLASVILVGSCAVTLLSYFRILSTLLAIKSRAGRGRAHSTFASHLTVVTVYYSTMIFVYVRPTTGNPSRFNKVLSVLYTILTPFLNPFIYSLRNKEVQGALMKTLRKVISHMPKTSYK